MEKFCDLLEKCDFFKKNKDRTSKFWKNIQETYCQGFLFPKCERRTFCLETGQTPPDDLMPTGELPEIFLKLP